MDRKPLPRIVYASRLAPGGKFGSGEEQAAMLARAFAAQDSLFLPLFIGPSEGIAAFDTRGVSAVTAPLERFTAANLATLVRIIDANAIDLVHWAYFDPIKNPYMWALSAVRPRLRHWYTDHISRFFPAKSLQDPARLVKSTLLRRYEGVICVSRFVEAELRRQRAWRRLTTQHHFINVDRFSPDPQARRAVRARMGVAGDRKVILFVGSLIHDKGCDLAIEAMRSLPTDCELWIAGCGPVEAELKEQARTSGAGDRIRFLGIQKEAQPLFQAADVAVTPSRWLEAAGFVNIEAQASALPVVASRTGGIPEYVRDGETGLLFEPRDATDLAAKLQHILGDDDMRRRLGRQARAHALAHFSPEAGLGPMLELYRNGVKADGAASGRNAA